MHLCLLNCYADFEDENASKRALTSFGKMLWRAIRKKKPWIYNGYGCYCGFGGKGDPVDDLDM